MSLTSKLKSKGDFRQDMNTMWTEAWVGSAESQNEWMSTFGVC